MPILPMPDYSGTFDGQLRTLKVMVPNGKTFLWETPEGETVRVKVKEGRLSVQWAWDAVEREWVDEPTWRQRRAGPNAGRFSVSKRSDVHRRLAERQKRQLKNLKRRKK